MIKEIDGKFYQEVNKDAYSESSLRRLGEIRKQRDIYNDALNIILEEEAELTKGLIALRVETNTTLDVV